MLGASRPWRPALLVALGIASGVLLATQVARGPEPPAAVPPGQRLFMAECAACHGPAGDGAGGAPALDTGLAGYPSPAALARYIRRAMPATAPGSLSPGQARALAAYLWALNHMRTP
jgi:mono/diheme cytochrome c family protein